MEHSKETWMRGVCGWVIGALALVAGCSSGGLPPNPGTQGTPGAIPGAIAVSIPPGAMGKGPAAYGVNPLVVALGATVQWTNEDSMAHTVTADDGSFDSGVLQPGQQFFHTFGAAGTFTYFCTIHGKASMSGAVQVGS